MNGQRFDTWAKVLTHTGGRRAATGLLAGGALGVCFGRLGVQHAAAACGIAGNKCCKGTCNRGAVCNSKGYCNCKNGLRNCEGDCITKKRCCEFDATPRCTGCQKLRCVKGKFTCVTGLGFACGDFCCQGNEACCEGWRGCTLSDPVCGDCKEECGDICCNLTQTCRRNANLSYECV